MDQSEAQQHQTIINEFLHLLIEELESSQSTFDRIIALSAFGSFGVEEIVPVLLSVIRGTPGQFDDTAERVRAILSLHRVVLIVPEKVSLMLKEKSKFIYSFLISQIHPILNSLASNIGERPEVRMAAIGILLMSNAPLSVWQKIATSTWFEQNKQIATFIHHLVHQIADLTLVSKEL